MGACYDGVVVRERPVNILYFIDHLRPDGTQVFLTQLVAGLSKRGHKQAIICLNNSWDALIIDKLVESGATVRIIGKTVLLSVIGLLPTLFWMRRNHFDTAITLLYFSDIIGRPLSWLAGIPYIVSSLRARNVNYNGVQRWLSRLSMRVVDTVVLNSRSFCDFAIREEGVLPDKVRIIPNSVRINDYSSPMDRSAFCVEMGIQTDKRLIGSVGRLTYQKGYDVLLNASALIQNRDFHIILVGTGEAEKSLRLQAKDLGIDKNVHFLGYRRDVPRLVGVFDLYVQPSRFEGMPNSLLEAMAAGCPVIASAVDGNCELIDDGVNGWLVPENDPQRLADAIQRAFNNPIEAKRFRFEARKHVLKNFSFETIIAEWDSLIQSGGRRDF